MKIFFDPNHRLFDSDILAAIKLLATDGSTRRRYFHFLTGYENLSAFSIPGTHFTGRIILKHHGNKEFEVVDIDLGHHYAPNSLKRLNRLEKGELLKKDYLEAITGTSDDSDEDSGAAAAAGPAKISHSRPAYYLRGKIVIPTEEQFDLAEHVSDFIEGTLDRKYTVIEGVPGAGKTLSVEAAFAKIISKRKKNKGGRRTIIYVAPKTSDLLRKMEEHIRSIAGGPSFLEEGLIKLHDYESIKECFNKKGNRKHSNTLVVYDEAQHLQEDHQAKLFKVGAFLAFGDMNQASHEGKHFSKIISDAKGQHTVHSQELTRSFRCPDEVIDAASVFLKARGISDNLRVRAGTVAETLVTNVGAHVKFYAPGFIDSIKVHSTEVSFITFTKERKEELVKQKKINVFHLPEVAGLDLQRVVIVMDHRELEAWLGDGSRSGPFNDLYMAMTRAQVELYLSKDFLFVESRDPAIQKITSGLRDKKYQDVSLVTNLDLVGTSAGKLLEAAIEHLNNNRDSQADQIFTVLANAQNAQASAIRSETEGLIAAKAEGNIDLEAKHMVNLMELLPQLDRKTMFDEYYTKVHTDEIRLSLMNVLPGYAIEKLCQSRNTAMIAMALRQTSTHALIKTAIKEKPELLAALKRLSIDISSLFPEDIGTSLRLGAAATPPAIMAPDAPDAAHGWREYIPSIESVANVMLPVFDVLNFATDSVRVLFHTQGNHEIEKHIVYATTKLISLASYLPRVASIEGRALKVRLLAVFVRYAIDYPREEQIEAAIISVLMFGALGAYFPLSVTLLSLVSGFMYTSHNMYSLYISLQHQALYDAIVAEDIDKVKEIVSANPASINRGFLTHESPLLKSIEVNNTNITKVLIYAGAGALVLERPLMLAALYNNAETTKNLMDAGLDYNDPGATEEALLQAIKKGYKEAAIALIQKGVQYRTISKESWSSIKQVAFEAKQSAVLIAMLDRDGNSISESELNNHLVDAIAYNVPDVVAKLIEKGADPNHNHGGQKMLSYAFSQGSTEAALVIARNSKTKVQTSDLHTAIDNNMSAVAIAIMGKPGININKLFQGKTLLLFAIDKKMTEVAVELVRSGAKLDIDFDGITPLGLAIALERPEVALAILDKSDIHVNQSYNGETPLGLAIEKKMTEVSVELIAKGADVNQAYKGVAPLFLAIDRKMLEVVIAIMDKPGVNINQTYEGKTPLLHAIRLGFSDLALAILDKPGIDVNQSYHGITPIYAAIDFKMPKVALAILGKPGINVNKLFRGMTSLHKAIFKNMPEVAMELIKRSDTKLDIAYNDLTPLYCAIDRGMPEIALALIVEGVNINHDHRGETVLYAAIFKRMPEVAMELIKRGAKLDVDFNGFTPLHLAIDREMPEVAFKLICAGAEVTTKVITILNDEFLLSMSKVAWGFLHKQTVNITDDGLIHITPSSCTNYFGNARIQEDTFKMFRDIGGVFSDVVEEGPAGAELSFRAEEF